MNILDTYRTGIEAAFIKTAKNPINEAAQRINQAGSKSSPGIIRATAGGINKHIIQPVTNFVSDTLATGKANRVLNREANIAASHHKDKIMAEMDPALAARIKRRKALLIGGGSILAAGAGHEAYKNWAVPPNNNTQLYPYQ